MPSSTELDVMFMEFNSGLTPLGAARAMFPWEIRAGINFAGIDRVLGQAQAKTQMSLDQVRDIIVQELVSTLETADTPEDAAKMLQDFAASQPPQVKQAIADSTDMIAQALNELFQSGSADVIAEAASQGVATDGAADEVISAIADFIPQAGVGPTSVWTKLTGAALGIGGSRAATVTDIRDGVMKQSIAQSYDLARQATNVTYNGGRKAAMESLPSPSEIYASELLDGSTCTPCADIDGVQFDDLDAGLNAYPDGGVYSQCDGGDRCRGTLVVVYADQQMDVAASDASI